jgi:hypothetical protein
VASRSSEEGLGRFRNQRGSLSQLDLGKGASATPSLGPGHTSNFGYTTVYPSGNVILMLAKDTGIRVRVEKELRQAFVEACRGQGLAASGVLRDFMHTYAERHQNGLQRDLFLNGSRQKDNPGQKRSINSDPI